MMRASNYTAIAQITLVVVSCFLTVAAAGLVLFQVSPVLVHAVEWPNLYHLAEILLLYSFFLLMMFCTLIFFIAQMGDVRRRMRCFDLRARPECLRRHYFWGHQLLAIRDIWCPDRLS